MAKRMFGSTLSVLVSALVCLVGLLAPTASFAVPACPEPAITEQPDGTPISISLRGDEHFHWHEDSRGYLVTKSPQTKEWLYSSEDNGIVHPTRHLVGHEDPAALGIQKPNIRRIAAESASAQTSAVSTVASVSAATKGTMKNLVILVSFADKPVEYTRQQFDDLFNQTGYTTDGAVGSVKDFYKEISYNQLTVQSTIVEAVTLDNGYAYYGANDSSGHDLRPREMVTEAIAKLDARGFDFTTVDGDGDGWVDGLDIIHAGGGEEYSGNDANYIWSHEWELASPVTYDGVKMQMYHTEPARRGFDSTPSTQGITRIGVICHETGHFLGLPDLYDYGYDSKGAGNFCLMAGGSWGGSYGNRPTHMSAYCKAFLGWVTPTLASTGGTKTLPQIETNQQMYKIQGACSSNEYFLVENRQGVGFDQSLPGSSRGILIWHIDTNILNNDDQTHYMVDLEEASCTQHLETNANSGDDSDYFRSGNATSFTSTTCPNNLCYGGAACWLNVTNVSATGSTMTFDISCQPVTITTSPTDQTIFTGATATFTTAASGLNLTYQWQVSTNGGASYANVSTGTGATTASYTTAAAASTDDGSMYRCLVSGPCPPSVATSAATLHVTIGIVLLTENFETAFSSGAPPGWTREFSVNTVDWIRNTGDHTGGSAAEGSYNALLYSSSSANHQTYLITPAIHFVGCGSAAKLEFWHKQAATTRQDTLYVYYRTSANGTWTLLYMYPSSASTWSKRTLSLPNVNSSYYIGFMGNAKGGNGVCIDAVTVTEGCCPPVITGQPVGSSTCVGNSVSLTVTATGHQLTYQWRKNGANISGASAATYTISSVSAGDAGIYDCLVTNPCGLALTDVAALAVGSRPTISAQPSDVTTWVGGQVSLSVTASGATSYQWRKGGSSISSAAASIYTIPSAGLFDAGSYDCVLTSSCGTTTSSAAAVAVVAPSLDIPSVKLIPDGQLAALVNKPITYASTNAFYVEDTARNSGIRIEKTSHGLNAGSLANVAGVMATNSDGERLITARTLASTSGSSVSPMAMHGSALGGSDFHLDIVAHTGQRGATGAFGPNNIGLLVKTWGRYTKINSALFTVDDGSGAPLECVVENGLALSSLWQNVGVVGVSSIFKIDDTTWRPKVLVKQIVSY